MNGTEQKGTVPLRQVLIRQVALENLRATINTENFVDIGMQENLRVVKELTKYYLIMGVHI